MSLSKQNIPTQMMNIQQNGFSFGSYRVFLGLSMSEVCIKQAKIAPHTRVHAREHTCTQQRLTVLDHLISFLIKCSNCSSPLTYLIVWETPSGTNTHKHRSCVDALSENRCRKLASLPGEGLWVNLSP